MKKSNIISFICGAVIFSSVTVFADEVIHAEKNKYPIYVDGQKQDVDGYNINDYTYLKLSDFKKLLPVLISFDDKSEIININTHTENQVTDATNTEDGLKIYTFDNKKYVSAFEIQDKYNSLVVGSPKERKIRFYTDKVFPAWDVDYMKPLIVVENFEVKNNSWYIDELYYESEIKPVLTQPRTNKYAYIKNDLNIYLDNNIEYVLPSDIIKTYFGEKYRFQYSAKNMFNILELQLTGNSYDSNNYNIILSNIPSKVVNGHLSIEYTYFVDTILPKIKK